jgi:hypothetical protein
MITVPVPANMYQAVVANMSHGSVANDGTVQFITAPMTTASRIKTEHSIVSTGGALSITPITSVAGGTVLQASPTQLCPADTRPRSQELSITFHFNTLRNNEDKKAFKNF